MANEKIYLYPLWVRLWHLFNIICFIFLLITGVSMQYSNPDISHLLSFEISVSIHNIFGVLISINLVFFWIFNRFSSNGKYYSIQFKGLLNRLILQTKYYMFGMFTNAERPFPISKEQKFNPLQGIMYFMLMYLVFPCLVITGFALLFPEMIVNKFFGVSGILLTALFHASLGFCLSLFLVIHVYVSTIGTTKTSNFRGIVNGYHS